VCSLCVVVLDILPTGDMSFVVISAFCVSTEGGNACVVISGSCVLTEGGNDGSDIKDMDLDRRKAKDIN
jgi:hypothetical protein